MRIGIVRIHGDKLIERNCVFHIFQRFPCLISRGITFPINKEFSSSMGELEVEDGLDSLFEFAFKFYRR